MHWYCWLGLALLLWAAVYGERSNHDDPAP